jgi:hypothetical protein
LYISGILCTIFFYFSNLVISLWKGMCVFMQRRVGQVVSFALLLSGSLLCAEEDGYWEFLTDFVYMQRSHTKDQTLVFDPPRCDDTCSSKKGESLNVKDLARGFGFEPGLQVALSYVQDPTSLYEAGFVYVWEWSNTKTKTSETSSLIVPFKDPTFTRDFYQVSKVQAYYSSQFYTVDLNYWKAFSTTRYSYLALSGCGGLRFASLHEKFSLTAFEQESFGEYDIKTKNDLIGLQLGFAFQINAVKGFHWDLEGQAGVGLNRIDVNSYLSDQSNTVQLRNFSKQDWQNVIFATATGGFGYRVLPNLDIHGGYEMLYFCGLAIAPEQIDTSSRTRSLHIDRNGYVIVNGIYVGFLFSF